jgi:carbamoyl-phosphate synthase large subunit
VQKIREASYKMARALKVVGLMNVQYAVKNDEVFILEVNPRASRTVPFISKAIGVPLAKIAAKVMLGMSLKEAGMTKEISIPYVCVKESVFPFNRFGGVDIMLGPEMRSTGEVMGIDKDFAAAFAKSQFAAYQALPTQGTVFLSVKNADKRGIVLIAQELVNLKFKLIATEGTAKILGKNGITAEALPKVSEGRPNILDYIKNKKVELIINTPSGRLPRQDEIVIRAEAVRYNIPCITTLSGARASVAAIAMLQKKPLEVESIQNYHKLIKK